MRIFLVLICSIALACVAGAQEPPKGKEKKKGAPAGQVSKPGGKPTGAGRPSEVGRPTGKPTGVGRPAEVGRPTGRPITGGKAKGKPTEIGKPTEVGRPMKAGKAKGKPTEVGKPSEVGKAAGAGKAKGKPTQVGKPAEVGKAAGAGKAMTAGKTFKPQHFNLPTKTAPTKVAPVTFQQSKHIEGSQNWQGTNYTVFRNYTATWHDRDWWRGHYNRVVFVFGGWYYWDAGYWFPAWGYAPDAYYAYDGPIYGYNDLSPDQVVANVQTALREQTKPDGTPYYQGDVDGILGPQTRAALADYQHDQGLTETAAIDQPTLQSLGMA
jgi:putative peptidoglycan binding protein